MTGFPQCQKSVCLEEYNPVLEQSALALGNFQHQT